MSKPRKWEMSQEAFENLLRCIDDDRDRAGEKYEQIRKALAAYYRENLRVSLREDPVDTAINRIARRIEEGAEVIYVESEEDGKASTEDSEENSEEEEENRDLDSDKSRKKRITFVKGKEEFPFLRAARFIVRESNKAINQREVSLESRIAGSSWEPACAPREKTKREQCLETCRVAVSDDEYEFILDYYSGDTYEKGREGRQQKDVRQEMAEARGISIKDLKRMAHRIRNRIKLCVENCVKE